MEFWGVEVKPQEKIKVQPEFCKLIHISQASLGEVKNVKWAKNIPLHVHFGDKRFVIGSLSAETRTQVMFDLVFEKEFELSHGWWHGSVYFIGYIADDPVSDGVDEFSGSESDELVPATENGHDEPTSEDEDDDDADDDSDSDGNDSAESDSGNSEEYEILTSEEELPQPSAARVREKQQGEVSPRDKQPINKRPVESPKMTAPGKIAKPDQKGSPLAGKGAGKPQGGKKFKGQKGKADGRRK